jgi:hypothetical protein
MEDPEIEQPTSKLRICRNPACLIAFDPKWRVALDGESGDAEFYCPRCGMDLDRNLFIKRPDGGQDESGKANDGI